MRIDFKFRHIDHNDELTAYITDRVERLEKFEHKPARIEFTFQHENADERVDIHIRGPHVEIHAHASSEDFFSAVDEALDKAVRQLERKKTKPRSVKKHAQSKVS